MHVRCLIDEAANIGQIPNLEKLMATIRSREISACLVLQAQSQLKALYKDNMDTIIGNCDSSLFLGGKEETTLKSWSSLLGKETIDMYNTSVTKGNQESHGQNFQKLGKDMPYLFVKSSVALNYHEQGHDQLGSEKLNTGGRIWSIYKENPSKRHQLHAGGRLLHPRSGVAGGKPAYWTVGPDAQSVSARTPARPVQCTASVEKLWTYLADLTNRPADRLACVVSQMLEAEGVTEGTESP